MFSHNWFGATQRRDTPGDWPLTVNSASLVFVQVSVTSALLAVLEMLPVVVSLICSVKFGLILLGKESVLLFIISTLTKGAIQNFNLI